MRTRPSFHAFSKARTANAAIEFALILPIMLVIFAGLYEFGRAFQVYGAINRLAARYALAWADCSDVPNGACNTELAMYTASPAIRNLVPQLTNTVTLRMLEITMSGTTPTVLYAYPTGTTTLTSGELATAQTAIPSGGVGVVVTVSYTHTLAIFQQVMTPFLGASRQITYTVAQLKS